MSYEDAKHRDHAIHTGEEPRNPITNGPESLRVTLDRWGPTQDLFSSMYDALQANWGESPSRTILRAQDFNLLLDTRVPHPIMAQLSGWTKLTMDERDYVESCFSGKTLQQVLEGVTFDFCIDGVSRAFTHQNVRTRLGAGFMQHGGRDNDWRHRPWTMPETMRRMCEVEDAMGTKEAQQILEENEGTYVLPGGLQHCITDWKPIDEYLNTTLHLDGFSDDMRGRIEQHIAGGRKLYAAMVDAGIPWQDARRVLFMGMQTYIHDQYNFLALQGVLANRLEHIMDWEFNCVAQLMLREVRMKCPPLFSKYLGSHSDKAKAAKFDGLESWPPDGKWPSRYERCKTCGHNAGNHHTHMNESTLPELAGKATVTVCEVCVREDGGSVAVSEPISGVTSAQIKGANVEAYHEYEGVDSLPRQHRSNQMPFFVLHPDSMAGGPIRWIPTNGKYPHEVIDGLKG